MPRMFTDTHRKKYYRRKDDPQYHGDLCEQLQLEGMETLKDLKYFQTAIGAMRRRDSMNVNTTRKFEEWERLGMLIRGNPDIRELQQHVRACASRMKAIRIAYTEAHSKRHNQPLQFEVRDADNNRVDVFVTYGAAQYCKLRSGLGATIGRYEEVSLAESVDELMQEQAACDEIDRKLDLIEEGKCSECGAERDPDVDDEYMCLSCRLTAEDEEREEKK